MRFDTKLVFVRENQYGAKLYNDFLNKCAVKIEEIPTPFEPVVMVNYQGDQYMDANGTRYFLMPLFNDMDPIGQVHQVRAQTKPLPGDWNVRWGQQTQGKSHVPSAPPMTKMKDM